MTLVLALNSWVEISVIADCRLTTGPLGAPRAISHDICQKLAIINDWCILGFAGDLCLGRFVLNTFGNRIAATGSDDPEWLRDEAELRRFLASAVGAHGTIRQSRHHRECCEKRVELLIAWVDHWRTLQGEPREPNDPEAPPPLSRMLTLSSPGEAVRRGGPKIAAIGNGAAIVNEMIDEAYMDIAWFARLEDPQYGWMHRAFMTMTVARDIVSEQGISGVGGLFQVASLAPSYVSIIPYFILMEVEPGYGTYVAMRMENGRWIQEHRPTGTIVPVYSPFEVQHGHPSMRRSRFFDPRRTLTRNSPGVVPFQQDQLSFTPYLEECFPLAVQESWGDEPLVPLTIAGEIRRRRP